MKWPVGTVFLLPSHEVKVLYPWELSQEDLRRLEKWPTKASCPHEQVFVRGMMTGPIPCWEAMEWMRNHRNTLPRVAYQYIELGLAGASASYALDLHTLPSPGTELKYVRTPVGEAIYRLKYQLSTEQGSAQERLYISEALADTLHHFIRLKFPETKFNGIIGMPSSQARKFQPVYEVSGRLAKKLNTPIFSEFLVKKSPNATKNIAAEDRHKALYGSMFAIVNRRPPEGPILLIDDLIETGSTYKEAARAIIEAGRYEIYFLALTQNRKALRKR